MIQISLKHEAPETLIEERGHPQNMTLHLLVTPISTPMSLPCQLSAAVHRNEVDWPEILAASYHYPVRVRNSGACRVPFPA